MSDTEKERELSEEGLEMNKENIVDTEEKESSLAADPESVTVKDSLSKTKNDSDNEKDDSSIKSDPKESKKDETSGEALASKSVDEAIESSKKNPPVDSPSKTPEVVQEDRPPEEKSTPPSEEKNDTETFISEQKKAGEAESSVESHAKEIDNSERGVDSDKDNTKTEETDIHPPEETDSAKKLPKSDTDQSENNASASDPDKKDEPKETEAESPEEDQATEPEEEEEEKDYSLLKKDELINEFEKLLNIEDLKVAEKKIKELKPFYDEIVEAERSESLNKFLEDGGVEIDFKYVGDALDARFSNLYEKYRARRNAYYSELEKSKEDNLARKQELLEKLRSIVDGEETNASISSLKNIQKEWRSIGPVPPGNTKSLWATYNILIDRFYDNRSIYFELKELDRKKNLEAKLELCEKAEHLLEYEVIRDAVKELNELHEEFKHIGPVPKEMQEVVWQRFKSASDAVYNRRKDYVSDLKKELHENLEAKKTLVTEVAVFQEFDSERISEWNDKTKEILDIQKKWEEIGGLPREHAKEVNKLFWSSFKTFFNNKNKFFKKLESQRDENLLKKDELVKRAESLKDSSDWEKTAEQLKELQKEWKDIGPVPEKNRNEVYKRFKKACDIFFNKRREHSREVESEYKVNLKKKEEICAEIEKLVEDKDKNLDRFKELQVAYNGIGYVPRNAIKKIQKKYNHATELFLNSFDLSETEKSELRFAAEVDMLKSAPNADRRIHRKEQEVRRLISKIENDIALWKNNIEFFAQSKTADKVREEFNEKIEKASAQLEELREELKVLNKI